MLKDRICNRRAAWLTSLLLVACGGGNEATAPAANEQPEASVPVKVPRSQALHQAPKKSAGDAAGNAKHHYIVQLAEPPVSAYEGGIQGHGATKPAPGQKVDAAEPAVARYKTHLASRHDTLLAGAGGGKKLHSYGYVFNGFAAELTGAQANKLAQTPGVLAVVPDERRTLAAAAGAESQGLDGRDGPWQEIGAKGENIVIGFIDSGIWPEHPSFSDRDKRGQPAYDRPRGWKGICQAGAGFTAADCNRKLIGARYFNVGDGGDAGTAANYPYEFASPRDYEGAGTHAASVAAGNAGVPATGATGTAFGKLSGVAPRARIAAYKACWGRGLAFGCYNIDLVAALDQAVADGVDVINFGVGSAPGPVSFIDPVAQAAMRAAEAGIFVVGMAGNTGPAASTAYSPAPWVTVVTAATRSRKPVGTLTLGNEATYTGASSAENALPATPMIISTDAATPGADADAAAQCLSTLDNFGEPVLDPAKVAGKIVVCDVVVDNPFRVEPSRAVFEAGGIGMVLLNTGDTAIDARSRLVPSVHLPATDRDAVKAYAALAGATAALSAARIAVTTGAPSIIADSGRGPTLASFGDLLAPDIAAPGQNVLAGLSAAGNGGLLFGIRSGTPAAAAHLAGLAAQMKELHPRWPPMAIKSALMTTAGDGLDAPNTDPSVIFAQGAGHVRPQRAADPGLVFESGLKDWQGFLCGTQWPASNCTALGVPVLDASDLNLASIAIGDLAGTQTVTRRVTNVDGAYATYTPSYTGMAGFDVAVSPPSLTLAPGQTKSFRVSFKRKAAALDAFEGGQLTWTGGTSGRNAERHSVRVPMVVRPVALSRPLEVTGSYSVKFGYSGPFSASARGLVAATTTVATVAQDESVDIAVSIPAGTSFARFALFDADVNPGTDLDFEVLDPAGQFIGGSFGQTSAEEFSPPDPAAGTYTVRIKGYNVPAGSTPLKLFAWALGSTASGNMVVNAPTTAVTAGPGAINLTFSGLVPGTKYLGAVVYAGNPALPAPTIVRVDP